MANLEEVYVEYDIYYEDGDYMDTVYSKEELKVYLELNPGAYYTKS